MDQLIADCADIPAGLRPPRREIPPQGTARTWSVNETCLRQVQQWDEYI
jgi:hypothetical protein